MVAVFHESTGQPSFVQDCTTLIVGYKRDILQARSCGTRMRLILGRAAMAEKCNQPLVSCDRFGDKDCSGVVREGEVPSVPGRAEPCRRVVYPQPIGPTISPRHLANR